MYQVLLADDEQTILDSMVNHIPWAQFDAKVAYTATTGKQACDILSSTPPDIAILDIRMPGYSGLELSRLVAQNGLKTQIIIMSGYAEFSYAQKAIQYGVLGYCVKPVEYDELASLLLKAIHNLQVYHATAVSSDDFLDAIEEEDTDKIALYLEENGIVQDTYYFAASVSDAAVRLSDALPFRIGSSQYGYLSCHPYDTDALQAALRSPGVSGIGFYPQPVPVREFRAALYRCLAMAYHFFLDPECRLCSVCHDFATLPLMPQIQDAVSFGEKGKLCELLAQLTEDSRNKFFSIHSAQQLFNMVLSNPKFAGDTQDYFIHSHRQLVHEYGSFREMIDSLIQIINDSPVNYEESDSLSNTYFLKIMKYINTYYNENITLKDVARVVNLNPNYISQLFKKTAGTTFSHYLTSLRISNAEKLLTTTDVSISEISLQTGFNDYFYFLKTFKKCTGHTPSEYRNREGGT